ncbi:Eukaryotic polypeptide chain release factor 3 [Mycena chlorophos]|uniref:Eukaryotic polypeptide chain release factor 3 n=1 Tax=Mycena chlorophos TaxID=658473 RepID=A0A8H6VQG0_MYCCL|nr:Eukaryotic polypeptide chain release factor 3 [Mycena chlorophos]
MRSRPHRPLSGLEQVEAPRPRLQSLQHRRVLPSPHRPQHPPPSPVAKPPPCRRCPAQAGSISSTAQSSAPTQSKTFSMDRSKTDTNAIANEVRRAADEAVLEDLYGDSHQSKSRPSTTSSRGEVNAALCGDNVRIRLRGIDDEEISPGFMLTSPTKKPIPANIICAGYSAVMRIHTLSEGAELGVTWFKRPLSGRRDETSERHVRDMGGKEIEAVVEDASLWVKLTWRAETDMIHVGLAPRPSPLVDRRLSGSSRAPSRPSTGLPINMRLEALLPTPKSGQPLYPMRLDAILQLRPRPAMLPCQQVLQPMCIRQLRLVF